MLVQIDLVISEATYCSMQGPRLLAIPLLIGISLLTSVLPSNATVGILMPDLLDFSESVSLG